MCEKINKKKMIAAYLNAYSIDVRNTLLKVHKQVSESNDIFELLDLYKNRPVLTLAREFPKKFNTVSAYYSTVVKTFQEEFMSYARMERIIIEDAMNILMIKLRNGSKLLLDLIRHHYYKPGGIGAISAEKEFYELASRQ